jgi:hypothetical protein
MVEVLAASHQGGVAAEAQQNQKGSLLKQDQQLEQQHYCHHL